MHGETVKFYRDVCLPSDLRLNITLLDRTEETVGHLSVIRHVQASVGLVTALSNKS